MSKIKTIVLAPEVANDPSNWKEGDVLVIGTHRCPLVVLAVTQSLRPLVNQEERTHFLEMHSTEVLIRNGIAHIERTVPEPEPAPANPFDHPAFEGWEKGVKGTMFKQIAPPGKPSRIIQLFDDGSFYWDDPSDKMHSPIERHLTLAANLPEAAEIINRLAPVAPAEVVAAAVVAFVKSKEAGK